MTGSFGSICLNEVEHLFQASTVVGYAPSHTVVWLMSGARSCSEPVRYCLFAASEVSSLAGAPNCEGTECPDVSESQAGIRISWNMGRCTFPGQCRFLHVCATCHQPHMARDCSVLSPYSKGRIQSRGTSAHSASPETFSLLGN